MRLPPAAALLHRTTPLAAAAASVVALGAAALGLATGSSLPASLALALMIAALWARVAARRVHAAAVEAPTPPGRAPRHLVSGLATREPLLARMAADGRGTLGIVAFSDYDRLCAFDPGAGDRVLCVLAERLRAMLPPSRLLAHVDRAHLAVWIDTGTPAAQAERELAAAVYTLGGAVAEGSGEVLPEVALRHLAFDAAADTPALALTRTIASFAVVAGEEGADTPADRLDDPRARFRLEQDLRQATARGELQLVYQPLIDAEQGRVCGAEALLRWCRDGVVVPPARFVPVMESAGLAREIGLWTLNAALRQAAEWRRAGAPPLRLAVNVSSQQMADDELPVVIDRLLALHGVPADALEVELTESMALGDAGRAGRLVETLRGRGVAVAIDDFGTGFSSLSTLRRLHFDKIKIDREFVTDVHRRRDSQAICRSILALGEGLGIAILAEGVEQQAEVEWLRRHGCRYFQGYRFAAPLSTEAFAAFAGDPAAVAALLAAAPAPRRAA